MFTYESKGMEATLTLTDNGDGTFSYEFTDPSGLMWDYGEADRMWLVASDADGNWMKPDKCGFIEIPIFGESDHIFLGNQTQTEFKSSDCEDWAHVNVAFATGKGSLPDSHTDGTVLIGEEGKQIEVRIVDGNATCLVNGEADGTITVNGIELSVESVISSFDNNYGQSWDITLNATLVDGQDAVEWCYVPVTAISENGSEAHMELNFRVNDAPFASSPASPTFLDLFNEMVDDDIDLSSKPEKAEEEQAEKFGPTFADLLMEESEYDDIVLPGGEYEPQEAGHANNATTLESSVIDGGDDLAMLAAQHEVENV